MSVHVFGVRHHGPGSARSVRAALGELAPDVVLVEGPPDAQEVLSLLAHADMKPPVALLVYASGAPSRAVFYPFATFSPEWQALSYALAQKVPARFMDLPQAYQLLPRAGEGEEGARPPEAGTAGDSEGSVATSPVPEGALEEDPLGMLAHAAGYADRELWWDHQVEQRRDAGGLFEAIQGAMAELRAGRAPPDEREARREAYMRRTIRAAQAEGFTKIAVVCGAWHGPALVDGPSAKSDDALLKGLSKVKVEATWIPWTYSRLSYRSGYGAGVASPGWYAHLWESPDRAPLEVARSYRVAAPGDGRGRIVGERHRDGALGRRARRDARPLDAGAGRAGGGYAVGAVSRGRDADRAHSPQARDRRRDRRGAGGDARRAPAARPHGDPEALADEGDLGGEAARARPPHGQRPCAQPALASPGAPGRSLGEAGAGRRREAGHLPRELDARVATRARRVAGRGEHLRKLGGDGRHGEGDERRTRGELDRADGVARSVDPRGAAGGDRRRAGPGTRAVGALRGRPSADGGARPLARTTRYGTVRETRAEHLVAIVDGLFERIVVGLVAACASLDDDAAKEMLAAITSVHGSVALLDRPGQRDEWTRVLRLVLAREANHGLVRGGVCRLLVEQKTIASDELERLARLALSPATEPAQAAAWAEGLLHGSALLLLHHDGVWSALDDWLVSLSEEAFVEMLPLVRRAFAEFSGPERRQMGEKVKKLRAGPKSGGAKATAPADDLDAARAALVNPVLSLILGVEVR